MLSERLSKLKKLSRSYSHLQNSECPDVHTAISEQQKLTGIMKLAEIVEDPERYDEFKAHRRMVKEKEREFKLERGYSIDRQAVLVWPGGKFLANFVKEAIDTIPFDEPHILTENNLQDAVDKYVTT